MFVLLLRVPDEVLIILKTLRDHKSYRWLSASEIARAVGAVMGVIFGWLDSLGHIIYSSNCKINRLCRSP